MDNARAYALLQKLTQYYEDVLWSSAGRDALEYLTGPKPDGRGFTEETVRTWRLGYAPAHGDLSQHFTITEMDYLKEVAQFNPGTDKDRFAGRVVFPIMDDRGQPLGFAGRILTGGKHVAKYINSPSTPWFRKGDALYGIQLAREAIFRANNAIVCEGFTDVIAAHQTGRPISVSIMGTYFTHHQLLLLGRYSMNLHLMFDADDAGSAATERSLQEARDMGFSLSNIQLPEGLDPDDFFLPAEPGLSVGKPS